MISGFGRPLRALLPVTGFRPADLKHESREMTFSVSGVEVSPLVPLSVGLVISLFTSMGGVSGAFMLTPFQVSVLGFTGPAVSPTSLVYNIVAIPAGVYRYIREGRMAWPLTWVIITGSVPGVILGVLVRIKYLPDPRTFKLYVGCVLLLIGGRLLYDLIARAQKRHVRNRLLETPSSERAKKPRRKRDADPRDEVTERFAIRTVSWSFRRISYRFCGETFSFSPLRVFPFVFVVGVVGGTYGIGGGAIIGPLLVTQFRLPVYAVAGAVLLSTFITSIAGVIFYRLAATHYADMGVAIAPDWLLGAMFGLGGMVGMYLGARCQKYIPARVIKGILCTIVLFVAARYISGFLL
jgi:uncharacterized membrane protein YfcA